MKTSEILIAHPQTEEQLKALKAFMKALKIDFQITKEKEYDADYVQKVMESREQYKSGDFTSVEKKDINSFLGLE